MEPSVRVPVATVPNPSMVKTLSTGILNISGAVLFSFTSLASSKSFCLSLSMFWPVFAETSIISASERNVSFTVFCISSFTASLQSSSARSAFVKAITPFFIFRVVNISRCSIVWGITPSSAAITIRQISMPPIPESIFLMNFSCPGTSIIPIFSPSSVFMFAKPSSMVIPLCCSSLSLSVSVPVSSFIRHVLP